MLHHPQKHGVDESACLQSMLTMCLRIRVIKNFHQRLKFRRGGQFQHPGAIGKEIHAGEEFQTCLNGKKVQLIIQMK